MKLTSLASAVTTAMQYAGPVSAAVQSVESVWGSSVPGSTKKQLVLSSIEAAAKVGEAVPEPHVAVISALIDGIVSILNATGIFSTSKATPAPAQQAATAPVLASGQASGQVFAGIAQPVFVPAPNGNISLVMGNIGQSTSNTA